MKKRNLTSLTLQKSIVSNLTQKKRTIVGGGVSAHNPIALSCLCSFKCSAWCIPEPTDATCPTTCTPKSCYACE